MRLIDADKLLDMLFRADLDYESMGGVNYCIDKIEGQPTAYDVEKVVEQLDDYLFEKHCIEGDGEPEKIIKGGGVNE